MHSLSGESLLPEAIEQKALPNAGNRRPRNACRVLPIRRSEEPRFGLAGHRREAGVGIGTLYQIAPGRSKIQEEAFLERTRGE